MVRSFSSGLSVFVASIALGAGLQASTLTVDDSGGADFTTITAAIAAATDGDVIVVRAGTYAAFDLDGRSLVIRGEGAGVVTVDGATSVRNLTATQSVEIAGLRFVRAAGSPSETFRAESCDGVLHLRACALSGASGNLSFSGSTGRPAAVLQDCALAIVHACTFRGGDGADYEPFIGSGATGLRTIRGVALVLESTSTGGNGGEDFDGDEDGGSGGDGATFEATEVRAAHATFAGGHGGFGGYSQLFDECHEAGPGGDGVQLLVAATFSATSVTYAPGNRGGFLCGFQPPPTGDSVAGGGALPLRFVPFCFGTEGACPCGNRGFGVAGCENSFATGGARLAPAGTPSVSADDVSIAVSGLPPGGTAILFQGTSALGASGAGLVFGDGLRCAGGSVRRLRTHAVSAGATGFGLSAGDPPISTLGSVPPTGGVFLYQVWYRNAAAYCTVSTFNLTHGLEILWSS